VAAAAADAEAAGDIAISGGLASQENGNIMQGEAAKGAGDFRMAGWVARHLYADVVVVPLVRWGCHLYAHALCTMCIVYVHTC
jgi:hypothetical protein